MCTLHREAKPRMTEQGELHGDAEAVRIAAPRVHQLEISA